MEVIRKSGAPRNETAEIQALAAALVHDVGHGPFSHAFEAVGKRLSLKMAHHEPVSDQLIRDSEITGELKELGSGFANDVADMITGNGRPSIYSAIVSSQFDADRLDYMRRDRLMTGTQHAAIDFEWLLHNLEVANVAYGVDETALGEVQTFVLGPKAIFAAEGYVLGLFQLYPTVYFHKATRGAEKIYTELLAQLVTLVRNDSVATTGLNDLHPLIKFAKTPDDIQCALDLDDTVVWGALSMMATAKDECISVLAQRLRDRKLYKSIDVRRCIAHEKGDEAASSEEADRACADIGQAIKDWSSSAKANVPRVLIDEEKRSPYKPITETNGPLDQINIRTDGDFLVDLADRSRVVAELQTYKLFRAYHAPEDKEAEEVINDIIQARVSAWPQ